MSWIADGGEGENGRLEVVGTVRGGCLSADRLVHLPGHGDFQLESVRSERLERDDPDDI